MPGMIWWSTRARSKCWLCRKARLRVRPSVSPVPPAPRPARREQRPPAWPAVRGRYADQYRHPPRGAGRWGDRGCALDVTPRHRCFLIRFAGNTNAKSSGFAEQPRPASRAVTTTTRSSIRGYHRCCQCVRSFVLGDRQHLWFFGGGPRDGSSRPLKVSAAIRGMIASTTAAT